MFTFRGKKEGGEKELDARVYLELTLQAALSGNTDLVDLELFTGLEAGREVLEETISRIKGQGVRVILSSHDFSKTPDSKELLWRFQQMEELGADILKEAVMPQNAGDVLSLLSATETASRTMKSPVITMAMGGLGLIRPAFRRDIRILCDLWKRRNCVGSRTNGCRCIKNHTGRSP